ncbi:MAG: NTP transferase domain-containing protein [Pseudonocardiales bacterium]|nr:NTP transferase domain-containing protein [Pseudonocardiales bacterium]MBV9161807.1 NTP transferase domain-containing protein [Pseudonocardiales bacterium]
MGHGAAGVVLVGGRSSRMGTPKAALEWHGSTLLRRTLGVLARSVEEPLVVVRAPNQPLPDLLPEVEVVEDPEEGRGPLQGIAAGLAALATRAQAAFVCSTDLPFLHPVFVRRVMRALTDDLDVVLPLARGYPQPLAAAYRVTLAPLVAELVAGGDLRPAFLFGHPRCRALRLDGAVLLADPELAAADPALESVVNVNSPEDYRAARARPAPQVTVQRYGALAGNGHRGPRTVRAATLSGAAAAVGLALDRHVIAALNGDQISRDSALPLASGDTIAFLSADAGG